MSDDAPCICKTQHAHWGCVYAYVDMPPRFVLVVCMDFVLHSPVWLGCKLFIIYDVLEVCHEHAGLQPFSASCGWWPDGHGLAAVSPVAKQTRCGLWQLSPAILETRHHGVTRAGLMEKRKSYIPHVQPRLSFYYIWRNNILRNIMCVISQFSEGQWQEMNYFNITATVVYYSFIMWERMLNIDSCWLGFTALMKRNSLTLKVWAGCLWRSKSRPLYSQQFSQFMHSQINNTTIPRVMFISDCPIWHVCCQHSVPMHACSLCSTLC